MPSQVEVKFAVPFFEDRGVRTGVPFNQGWLLRLLCGN